jgi:branched-chain amino acid transport system substrate-binding protein
VTPLSGSYAPIGKQVRWGAELAVKEINAAGGVLGRPFELLFEDEEASPPVAVRKSEKLLQQDKVDLLTGTVNSGPRSQSAKSRAQQSHPGHDGVLCAVDHRRAMQPNVFRVNANAFMQSNALTSWLTRTLGQALFHRSDYEMGRSTIFPLDRHQAAGAATSAPPPLGAKDFTPYVRQIRRHPESS